MLIRTRASPLTRACVLLLKQLQQDVHGLWAQQCSAPLLPAHMRTHTMRALCCISLASTRCMQQQWQQPKGGKHAGFPKLARILILRQN